MIQTPTIESIDEALQELGANEDLLTPAERKSLDEEGFTLIPNFLNAAEIDELRNAYENVIKKEGKGAGLDHHQEEGARRIGDLVNKGTAWDRLYVHPKLLAAAHHILKDEFKLGAYSGRDPLKGFGQQGYHMDCGWQKKPDGPFLAVSVMLFLDDFTVENGAPRLIPKSHLTYSEKTGGPVDPHPDEIRAVAPAGTALIFNAHLWHGGMNNHSGAIRRMVHVFYQARTEKQWLNQKESIRKITYDRISNPARYILDV